MKKFITSVACVSVFFIGLGTLVEKVGAKFKSDEKALALIQAAPQAIGGDAAIANEQSLRIKGRTIKTLKLQDSEKSVEGDTEIALQLPNKFSKHVKLGDGGAEVAEVNAVKQVVVIGGEEGAMKERTPGTADGTRKFVLKSDDGDVQEINTDDGHKIIVRKAGDGEELPMRISSADGKEIIVKKRVGGEPLAEKRNNELFHTMLGLLLSSPAGMDVSYTYGGEQQVDSRPCNVVVATFGGDSVKLYLDSSSNLPVMIAYTGMDMPHMIKFDKQVAPPADGQKDVIFFRSEGGPGQTAEFQVRFSDYRSVDGVQLPYKWVTTVNGAAPETLDVANYEVNPANIADAFGKQKIFVRTPKPDQE
jgi:hypothetical protein